MNTSGGSEMDRVIAKIQKCFDRTKNGATHSEEEANTAMRIAQELMLKYNLDMATIEAAGRSHEDTGAVRVKEAFEGKTRFKWQRDLAKYVAEANFCYHLIKDEYIRDADGDIEHDARGNPKQTRNHVFVGRKSNVITAQMMYSYLTQTIEDNAPADDSRAQAAVGKILYASYKSREYSVLMLEDGACERIDYFEPYAKGEFFKSLSAAGKFIRGGKETNGYVFFGLGNASTAVSWKEGCADRICERLAQKRADLVAAHDARVRQEQADQAAEIERRRKEAEEKAKRKLNPREATADEFLGAMSAKAFDMTDERTPDEIDENSRPQAAEDDDWSPGDSASKAEQAPQFAMVLASQYDEAEREANEELAKGLPPGTFAKWRAEAEERRIAREKRAAEQAAARANMPEEEWEPGATLKEETEKQRAARLRREAADNAKWRRQWAREDAKAAREAEKEHARRDHNAYKQGMEAGAKVGLDPQIARDGNQKKLGQ